MNLAFGVERLICAVLMAVSLSSVVTTLQAQEWTRFRGPNGSGIGQARTIPVKIGDADLNWKSELPGSGHSSPVLWGERIFVTCTGDASGGISIFCLSAREGKTLWKRDFPLSPFVKHANNSFASSTPAVDAELIYVAWNEPDHYSLTALDHQGKTAWQRDFGPNEACESPCAVALGRLFIRTERHLWSFGGAKDSTPP
jgi:outer membrane protein assembly factor BamB